MYSQGDILRPEQACSGEVGWVYGLLDGTDLFYVGKTTTDPLVRLNAHVSTWRRARAGQAFSVSQVLAARMQRMALAPRMILLDGPVDLRRRGGKLDLAVRERAAIVANPDTVNLTL